MKSTVETVSLHELLEIHYSFLGFHLLAPICSNFVIWENLLRTKLTDFSAFLQMSSLLKGPNMSIIKFWLTMGKQFFGFKIVDPNFFSPDIFST